MKKLLSILLAFLLMLSIATPAFAFPASGEGDSQDKAYGVAKGYVRTKEIRKSTDGYSNSTVTSYDKKGNPLKKVDTWSDGESSSKTIYKYTYDKKGRLTKEVGYYYDFIATTVYTYNKNGTLKKEIHTSVYEDNSTFVTESAYTYNEAGLVTKQVSYYDDCEDVTLYTYNKAGKVTKEAITRSYEDNTQTKVTTTFTYDKKGNETKSVITEKDRYGGSEKRVYVSTYNEKNRCVKVSEVWNYSNGDGDADTSRNVTTYTYDKKGNVTKEAFKSVNGDGSKRTVTFLYTYDADGNMIKWVTSEKSNYYTGKNTRTYTYKAGLLVKETSVTKDEEGASKSVESYTYDKAGNLTKYVCNYQYADGTSSKDTTTYTYQKIGA